MVLPVLKFSEIKKNPNVLTGINGHAAIIRYGDVVAYVVTPERMEELLYAEEQFVNLNNLEVGDESN